MKHRIGAWAVSAAFLAAPGARGEAAPVSGCVACHRAASGVAYVDHNFADWTASIHAKAGASCDACHGGNPAAKDKTGAHAGVLPSSAPDSRVYYTKLPGTCGSCHAAELAAFRKSRHFEELNRTGKGPNCATCHGSMASHILEPRMMQMTCTLCHRQPSGAQAALMSLNNAGIQLGRLKQALARAKADGVEPAAQRAQYEAARKKHDDTRVAWHAFDMPAVLAASQEITRSATTALNELALKRQQR